MYTVLEISRKLGTSKATIYRKMGSIDDMDKHVTLKNKTKYIDEEGFLIIKKAMTSPSEIKNEIKTANTKIEDDLALKHSKYIENLEEEIDYLREELQIKNDLLHEQIREIANNQNQLLLMEREKKIKTIDPNVAVDMEKENQEEAKKKEKKGIIKLIKKVFNNKAYS